MTKSMKIIFILIILYSISVSKVLFNATKNVTQKVTCVAELAKYMGETRLFSSVGTLYINLQNGYGWYNGIRELDRANYVLESITFKIIEDKAGIADFVGFTGLVSLHGFVIRGVIHMDGSVYIKVWDGYTLIRSITTKLSPDAVRIQKVFSKVKLDKI